MCVGVDCIIGLDLSFESVSTISRLYLWLLSALLVLCQCCYEVHLLYMQCHLCSQAACVYPTDRYELVPTEKSDETQSSTQQTTSLPLSTQFTLRRMACFGSPKFDRKEPLHILSADSRFPDIEPSRIRKVGNHFLALFPVEKSGGKGSGVLRRALVRGGENKLVENAVVRKSDDDNVVVEDAKRADRWDGGRGRWSARSADSVIVGEALGVERFVRRIERTMGSSMQWIMSRLVGFVAMNEVR